MCIARVRARYACCFEQICGRVLRGHVRVARIRARREEEEEEEEEEERAIFQPRAGGLLINAINIVYVWKLIVYLIGQAKAPCIKYAFSIMYVAVGIMYASCIKDLAFRIKYASGVCKIIAFLLRASWRASCVPLARGIGARKRQIGKM